MAKVVQKLLILLPHPSKFLTAMIKRYLHNLYRLLRYHPPELLNPYLNLQALRPIQVESVSKDYSRTKLNSDFTAVIVVRNEADSIASLLMSIENQSILPAKIFLIDGGSTDNTVKIINRYKKTSKLPLEICVMPFSTISEGANFGIANASTELIITLHAGCILDHNCFANLIGPISADSGIDLVAGLYHSPHQSSVKYLVPDWEAIDWYNFIPSSRLCCFKKSIAIEVGLFSADLVVGEDTDFFVKYRSLSKKWVINKNAFLFWDNPSTQELHDRVLYKYAVGDGISGFGDYLYYSHYRSFERTADHNKSVYIAGYKAGKKQRYGHLFYKEKIRGILIIFADSLMYQNHADHKLLSLINKYTLDKWYVLYLAPSLHENLSITQPGIYLPLDLTKVHLLPLEAFLPFTLKSYLANVPLPVNIINNYRGSLWKFKILLTNLLYSATINK